MPRDGSGNYTLPAGNPVVSGTTITSVWANTTFTDDVAPAIEESLSRDGNGAMRAPLLGVSGIEALPAFAFTVTVNSGMYWDDVTPALTFSVLGTDSFRIEQGGAIKVWNGSAWVSVTGAVEVSATAPVSPTQGVGWFDPETGTQYMWYDEAAAGGPGTSSEWIPWNAIAAISQGANLDFPDAPADEQEYDPGTGVVYIYNLAKTRWELKPLAPTVEVLTTSGTWTKPAGLVYASIEVQGSGAAGGGVPTTGAAQASVGGGGGAGGYTKMVVLASALGATENYVIGAAGTGVVNAPGGNGAASTFGTVPFLTGNGGIGGRGGSVGSNIFASDGGAGGSGSGGDVVIPGEGGDGGYQIGTTLNPTAFTLTGRGGSCPLGAGGRSEYMANSSGGLPGANFGAGGSGAGNGTSETQVSGGDGAPGVVIVTNHFK